MTPLKTVSEDEWTHPKIIADNQEHKLMSKTLSDIRSLLKNECCNYDNGNCIVKDLPCPQLTAESVVCKWLADAVLPLNPELGGLCEVRHVEKKPVRLCVICGKTVVTGRAQYCPKCSQKQQRIWEKKSKLQNRIKCK